MRTLITIFAAIGLLLVSSESKATNCGFSSVFQSQAVIEVPIVTQQLVQFPVIQQTVIDIPVFQSVEFDIPILFETVSFNRRRNFSGFSSRGYGFQEAIDVDVLIDIDVDSFSGRGFRSGHGFSGGSSRFGGRRAGRRAGRRIGRRNSF